VGGETISSSDAYLRFSRFQKDDFKIGGNEESWRKEFA
jgi:hypothetical protein